MATPRYLVTKAPGAQVRGLGFLEPGTAFNAPSADYQPSKSFRPCNAEAQAVLKKLLEPALKSAKNERVKKELEEQLKIVELAKPKETPTKGAASDKELAELERRRQGAGKPGGSLSEAGKAESDRKL